MNRKRERKKKNEPSTQNNTALTNEHDYNVRIVIQTQNLINTRCEKDFCQINERVFLRKKETLQHN